jgi:hypothetical protein
MQDDAHLSPPSRVCNVAIMKSIDRTLRGNKLWRQRGKGEAGYGSKI